jgi:hypothetical protein
LSNHGVGARRSRCRSQTKSASECLRGSPPQI